MSWGVVMVMVGKRRVGGGGAACELKGADTDEPRGGREIEVTACEAKGADTDEPKSAREIEAVACEVKGADTI